jgi:GT2 family glycosyltransferase
MAKGRGYKEILRACLLIQKVDVLSGRGTLIPVEVFQKIGLYNFKRLPHYGADYEFSHRANIKGYRLLINYEAVVISDVHSNGINTENWNLSWLEFAKLFFSKRSPCNIGCRWNFARLSSPKHLLLTFFIFDIGRLFCGFMCNKLKAYYSNY